jgi:hypothetical protein
MVNKIFTAISAIIFLAAIGGLVYALLVIFRYIQI